MDKSRRFSLRQIEVFRTVMVEGSITKAALALQISQPAVSQWLRVAEDQLQFKLFERNRGRLTPTREGRILFAESDDLVSALERVQRQAENLRRRHEASIELLISPSLALSLLPSAVLAFRQIWPSVQLSCEPLSYREIVSRLSKEQGDIGIAVGPRDEENLDTVRIGRVSLVCALPQGHHLASEEVVTPHHLAE
jgi:DNA-binding transcriptional LysR family regulator